jgi:hypothetical protein
MQDDLPEDAARSLTMNCQLACEQMTQADTPDLASLSPEIRAHVAQCDICRGFLARLARLEQSWRNLPLSASALQGRDEFLARLDRPAHPSRPATDHTRSWKTRWSRPRALLTAAAVLLLGVGLLLFRPTESQAAEELLDRLLDENLALAELHSLQERTRVYEERIKPLSARVPSAHLSPEDRLLASSLMEIGAWLVRHDDPVELAERFQVVAGHALTRMHRTALEKKIDAVTRAAQRYQRLQEKGVQRNLEQARMKPLSPAKQQKLERIQRREAERIQALTDLIRQVPDPSRKEIRKALKELERRKARTGKKPGK